MAMLGPAQLDESLEADRQLHETDSLDDTMFVSSATTRIEEPATDRFWVVLSMTASGRNEGTDV